MSLNSFVIIAENQDFPGSNFSVTQWGLEWINDHIDGEFPKFHCTYSSAEWNHVAGNRANKPVVLEEFGVTGLGEPPDGA